jgi:hypothetical protein
VYRPPKLAVVMLPEPGAGSAVAATEALVVANRLLLERLAAGSNR